MQRRRIFSWILVMIMLITSNAQYTYAESMMSASSEEVDITENTNFTENGQDLDFQSEKESMETGDIRVEDLSSDDKMTGLDYDTVNLEHDLNTMQVDLPDNEEKLIAFTSVLSVLDGIHWEEEKSAMLSWNSVEHAIGYTLSYSIFDFDGNSVGTIPEVEIWEPQYDFYPEIIKLLVAEKYKAGYYSISVQIRANYEDGTSSEQSGTLSREIDFVYPDEIRFENPQMILVYNNGVSLVPHFYYQGKEIERWPSNLLTWELSDPTSCFFFNGNIMMLHKDTMVTVSLTMDDGSISGSIKLFPAINSTGTSRSIDISNTMNAIIGGRIPNNTDITVENCEIIKNRIIEALENGRTFSVSLSQNVINDNLHEYDEMIKSHGFVNPVVVKAFNNTVPVYIDDDSKEILFYIIVFPSCTVSVPDISECEYGYERKFVFARLGEDVSFVEGQFVKDDPYDPMYGGDICVLSTENSVGEFVLFYYDIPMVFQPEWQSGSNASVGWSRNEDANYYEVTVNLYAYDYELGNLMYYEEMYDRPAEWMILVDSVTTGTEENSIDVQQEIHQMVNRNVDTIAPWFVEVLVYPVVRDELHYIRGELLGITKTKHYQIQKESMKTPSQVRLSSEGILSFVLDKDFPIDSMKLVYKSLYNETVSLEEPLVYLPVSDDGTGECVHISFIENDENSYLYYIDILQAIKDVYQQKYNNVPVDFSVAVICFNNDIAGSSEMSSFSEMVTFSFETEIEMMPIPENLVLEDGIISFDYPSLKENDQIIIKTNSESETYVFNSENTVVSYSNGIVSIDIDQQMRVEYLYAATDQPIQIIIEVTVQNNNMNGIPNFLVVESYKPEMNFSLSSPINLILDWEGNFQFEQGPDTTDVNDYWANVVLQDPLVEENRLSIPVKPSCYSKGYYSGSIEYDLKYLLVRGFEKNGCSVTVYVWAVNTDDTDSKSFNAVSYPVVSNTVERYNFAEVERLSISPSKPVLAINNDYCLGKTIEPAIAYYEEIDWSSSDESIVTVDESGTIHGVGCGTASVTGTIHTSQGDVCDSVEITVYSIEVSANTENDKRGVAGTAGSIIDELLNDNKDFSEYRAANTTNLDSEIKDNIQNDILEAIINGDEIGVDVVSYELADTDREALWNRIISEGLLDQPVYVLANDTNIEVYHQGQDEIKEVLFNITELEDEIEITFQMPELDECLIGYSRNFKVARLHNGEIDYLDCVISEDGICTIKSDKFSEYVLLYEDVSTQEKYEKIMGASLSLEGNIGLNFFAELSDEFVSNGGYILLKHGNVEEKIMAKDAVKTDYGRKFSCWLPAKNGRDPVTFQMFSGDGKQLVFTNSQESKRYREYSYSIGEYIDAVNQSQDSGYDKVKILLPFLDTYIKRAAAYFANSPIELDPYPTISTEDLSDFQYQFKGQIPASISDAGVYLTLESQTILNVAIEGNGNYDFTVDGQSVETQMKENQLVVSISNISAKDLDVIHEVIISEGDEIFTVMCSPLGYVEAVLKNWDDTQLIYLVKALYMYNCAANVYFAK